MTYASKQTDSSRFTKLTDRGARFHVGEVTMNSSKMTVGTILAIIAIVCFFLAGIGVGLQRVNLMPLGLFFWALGTVVGGVVIRR